MHARLMFCCSVAPVALYVRAVGSTLGEKLVASDVKAMLSRKYQTQLEDLLKP